MHGADPHVGTNREITPSMATTDIFLGIYLKQAEKAYSIIKFIYEFKKQKQILKKIRDTLIATCETHGNYVLNLYQMFCSTHSMDKRKQKMGFYEVIKQAQVKLITKNQSKDSEEDQKIRKIINVLSHFTK